MKKIHYPKVKKFSSASTAWGCEHESDAIQVEHVGVEYSRCGLTISVAHPFLGASPDSIGSCSCHGKMFVKVRYPYRCSCQQLQDVAVNAKHFCLQETDGNLALDHKHAYYYIASAMPNVCVCYRNMLLRCMVT